MKNKINIMSIGIFFLILTIIFLPAKNIQAAGCCVITNNGTTTCTTPVLLVTGQEICSSGTLINNSCSNINACNQVNNATTGNNSTNTNTNTNTFPTTNSAIPMAFSIPTGFGFPDPQGGVEAIIENLLDWLLGIIGAIAVIAFVVSGAQYLMASGNEKIAEIAKRNMTYSILGVIVALSGMVIIQAIDAALRAWVLF